LYWLNWGNAGAELRAVVGGQLNVEHTLAERAP
jgi:hypothetical protein